MGDTEEVAVEKAPVEHEEEEEAEKVDEGAEPLEDEELDDGLDEDGVDKRSARALDENWDAAFEKILKFRAKHGHCNVPSRYPGDPHLG